MLGQSGCSIAVTMDINECHYNSYIYEMHTGVHACIYVYTNRCSTACNTYLYVAISTINIVLMMLNNNLLYIRLLSSTKANLSTGMYVVIYGTY